MPARTATRRTLKHLFKGTQEKNIIPGSFATPEAIAHIMTQKFVMGSPLCRQEQELNHQGIGLSWQTMSNWILRAAVDYLTPIYEQLHRELLKRDVLHSDETTLQVLHEPEKTKARVICGCTGPAEIWTGPLICTSTRQGGVEASGSVSAWIQGLSPH